MHQDATWYGGRPQSRQLCVRWGASPSPKRGRSPPICGPFVLWPKGCMYQDTTELGLSLGDIVLDGDPASPPQNGHSSRFLANVCCGQIAEWMKTPLSKEVDLGQGHIALDWDPVPPRKGHSSSPLFGPCLLWPRSPISATAELLLQSSRS